ncbi:MULTISPECIES: carboxylesterase/lipase family protein [unclassified Crossiella]|uniref:carboxylesterase/lipase family protein n=1 Tax=unclassified Crossiella TaxID=2620835 RepID=UPI001FFE4750|nr:MULTISPECIES: carboxylesterase family protein [unclassified Crossiella]MCK2238942.1 carboxylesterase family protein [Crossiella sp. S99.2]MCK2251488.1 carboxylesterase family protein [Crossiella sp. S99.1]
MDTLVSTRHGDVRGTRTAAGILEFKGISYAAPPVGPNRFQPPRPPLPWSEPREATEYGPTAPQNPPEDPALALLPRVVIPGEDYLNLNVWTPGTDERRPVMVFIHGGSFTGGSGSVPCYDGAAFARDGVVLVTINYRLGADGFLWFGQGAPNLGLLDQIAALAWVRDNIAGFGGDPANVTIFGESAGGMSVCTLLAMPAARGLFRRAIAQSGAGHSVISPSTAALIGTRLAQILGVAPSREAIAEVEPARLVAAQEQLAQEVVAKPDPALWGEVTRNLMPFEPVVDGDLLSAPPHECIAAGASADIDILIGSNTEEARLFLVPTGLLGLAPEPFLLAAAAGYRLPAEGLARYRANRPGESPGELVAAIMTDWFYRIPLLRIAETHPSTHVYEFAWRSPAYEGTLGSCHAVELGFVFDTLADPGLGRILGDQAPQALADSMHRAWVDFATTGDPGWPAYRPDNRVSRLFNTVSSITTDDRADERAVWDGHR